MIFLTGVLIALLSLLVAVVFGSPARCPHNLADKFAKAMFGVGLSVISFSVLLALSRLLP